MAKRDIDSLMNRGKHFVCQYITTGCYEPNLEKSLEEANLVEKHLSQHDHSRVHSVIDHLFDFRNKISAKELVEWTKYMIGGRRLPNTFSKEVKQYDTTSKCMLVWTTNFVAFRCRTCAISLCMSLCSDCFLNGNHEGHDFNMFRSQAGGACDCGDPFVMKEDGFCKHHQPKPESIRKSLPPNSLICIANEMVPRLLYYLVLYLRENNFPHNKRANALLNDVLIYLNDLGTLMQSIICKALTDPEIYKSSLNSVKDGDLQLKNQLMCLQTNYLNAVDEIQLMSIFPGVESGHISDLDIVKEIDSFKVQLVHNTFLDEIIFWTIINEFPSNIITFLLKMLPDEEYKIKFAESFVKHYFRISMLIMHPTKRFSRSLDRDIYHNKLANAVVHISVQLFSNENLALLLCERSKLLYIIILSLKFAISGNGKDFSGIVVPNLDMGFPVDKDRPETLHYVVQCEHLILRYHRFWPTISDLNNLFTHKRVAYTFLSDKTLIDVWLEFIMSFQAMNLNVKNSVSDDPYQNYKSSYLAELEICASQMWTLISHLNDEDSKHLTINFVQQSLQWLNTWLRRIGFNLSEVDINRCTFHLPLHRYYSLFVHHAVTVQKVPLDQLLPPDNHQLKCFITHPLQTLIASNHIMANLWICIGLHIKTQALNYMHPHFSNSTIDADVFLVQQAATHINPDEFVEMYFKNYGLKNHLNLTSLATANTDKMDEDKLIVFLENGFTFLATIVSVQINLGMSSSDITRKEMVSLLSVSDKAHSQIHDMLPYKCGFLQNNPFTDILNDIAEYKSPEIEVSGSLVQGYFYPKNRVWEEEYDPLFVLYRNAQRRDFQASLERFAAYAKQSGKYKGNSFPWPPFRIEPSIAGDMFTDPRTILNSKLLHAYLFSTLYKALNDPGKITQHLLSIVIYLIEMTLVENSKRANLLPLDLDQPKSIDIVTESKFETWFTSDDIMVNFLTTIQKTEFTLKNTEETIKAKIFAVLFSSLMPDAFGMFRSSIASEVEDEYNIDNSTITIEHQNDDEDVELNFELGNAETVDSEESSHSITMSFENENYRIVIPSDDEDDEFIEVNSLNIQDSNMSIVPMDSNFLISSIEESESLQPSTSNQSETGRNRSKSILKTKPVKMQLDINESMLSLLLKLHSKLSEKRDSFKTDPANLDLYDLSSRIGDGSYFIGCLLKRFIILCTERLQTQADLSSKEECFKKVISIVDSMRQMIWPKTNVTGEMSASSSFQQQDNIVEDVKMETDAEELERIEKKRRALERKQQIMNKFCMLQQSFMKNNETTLEEIAPPMEDCSMEGGSDKNADSSNKSRDSECTASNSAENSQLTKFQPKSYQCVICGDMGFSTLERSFVQVVLLQSSSILGNSFSHTLHDELAKDRFSTETLPPTSSFSSNNSTHVASFLSNGNKIPTTDEERSTFCERRTFANYFEQRVDTCCRAFALDSWLSSFNIGWCGGVHAQSCGHFMHLDCYQSYISSVYTIREVNDLIEYSCPLCRKVANSVLPIIPNFANLYALVKSRNNDPQGVTMEILDLLSNGDQSRLANTTEDESKFLKVLAMAIEDVMKATEPQYRNIRVDPCPQSLFLFLSSISRTNLEFNIILWKKNIQINQNASCLVPLFQALSLNAKLVLPMHYTRLWSQITGIDSNDSSSHLWPYEKHVPLLVKDVSAILLQILYALPFNIDKAYFITIVQALLNLNFIQAVVLLTYMMPLEQKMEIKSKSSASKSQNADDVNNFTNYTDYIGFILNNLDINNRFSTSFTTIVVQNRKQFSEKIILKSLAKICLPFMRIASMLFYLLFNQPKLPPNPYDELNDSLVLEEFSTLANYLNLNTINSDSTEIKDQSAMVTNSSFVDKQLESEFFKPYINWMNNPTSLIKTWYNEFDKFVQNHSMAAMDLIQQSFTINFQPRLLQLPTVYEQLFMYYHKMTCVTCDKIPKDPSICLICGQLICIRDNCCRDGSSFEGVTHSKKCGAGTAIYLAINSSTIIVILGRKACVWGSVYLDEYGEEDRDLKRGKPLFLCKERYRTLEQQWLTHSFLYINKKWIYHKDAL